MTNDLAAADRPGFFKPDDVGRWFALVARPDVVGRLNCDFEGAPPTAWLETLGGPAPALLDVAGPADVEPVPATELLCDFRVVLEFPLTAARPPDCLEAAAPTRLGTAAGLANAKWIELTDRGRRSAGLSPHIRDVQTTAVRRTGRGDPAPPVHCPFCRIPVGNVLQSGAVRCPGCNAGVRVHHGEVTAVPADRAATE